MSQDNCPKCENLAPPWMATFADMAILLMAFFALLYSFSEVNIRDRAQFAATIRAAFGVDRKIVIDDIPTATSLIDESFTAVIAESKPLAELSKEARTPVRRYRAKYTQTEDGLAKSEITRVKLERTLAEDIIKGEVEVKAEDELVVIELRSLFTTGGKGEDYSALENGARVKQSAIDIAAKVLAVSSDNDVQIDFRARDYSAFKSVAVQNNFDLESHYDQIQQILLEQKSKDSLKVFLKDDLLTIRLASQDSFDSGQAGLKPKAKILLDKIGAILTTSKGTIRVEGHTDDMPLMFSESFVSNWDLSAARASSVAAALINNSAISQSRLVIAGFGDSRPLKGNKTPEGRSSNRRIEIIVSAGTKRDITPNG